RNGLLRIFGGFILDCILTARHLRLRFHARLELTVVRISAEGNAYATGRLAFPSVIAGLESSHAVGDGFEIILYLDVVAQKTLCFRRVELLEYRKQLKQAHFIQRVQ